MTLSGANVDKGAVLIWGGEHVPQFTVESATTATVVTPKHAAGAVDITIINPDGQAATLPNGFVYMFDVPAVYTVDPKAGLLAGGNTIALSGYGFEAGMAVHVGSKPCDKVAVQDATLASCTVPAGDAAGSVAVKVTNTKGLQGQLPKAYTYLLSTAAEISAVLPSNGPPSGGIPVVLKGKNLPEGVEVTFGGQKAVAIAPPSAEVAAVTLPPGKPGPVDVALVVKGEFVASAKGAFVYDEPQPPVITKISPPTGPAAGGITVVVEGTNLPANPTLTFGSVSAQVVSAAATAIVLVLPAGSAGPVDVTVSGIGGSATSKGGFTYQAAVAPSVTAVVPNSGPAAGGIVVVVQGKDLSAKSKVLFGGKAAATTYLSGSEGIGVLLPPGDPGSVDVTVQTPGLADAVLKSGFSYNPAVAGGPKIALVAVQPAQSPTTGGAWALLKGANLPQGCKVFFGSAEAKDVLVLGQDLVAARIPAAAAAGAVDVSLVDPQTQAGAKLANALTYYDPKDAKGPPPKLDAIKPGIGPSQGGTLALLEGKAFAEGALVFFGGRPASGVLRVSAEVLTLTTPSSPPGPTTVMVVHPDGQWSELGDAFVYTAGAKPTLTVTGALPGQGSAAGGTDVVLQGTGLAPGLLLFIDGAPHPVSVKTAKAAALVTPPHAPGTAQVALTSADGWTALVPGGYLYILEPPFVAAVSPSWSPPAGGAEVVVAGQGFHPKAKVSIGGAEATVLTATPNALKVSTPAGKKGKADVTVTNPDGLFDTLELGLEYTDVAPGKELKFLRAVPAVASADGGAIVVVHGNGFQSGAQVIVGGALAPSVVVIDAWHLQVAVPKGKPGAADIEVVVPDLGSAKGKNAFYYFDPASAGPAPKLHGVLPGLGPVSGGTVAMLLVDPAKADAKVFFGGEAAKVLGADNDGHLVVETPAHAAGPVDVAVMLADGKADVRVAAFSYYEPAKDTKGPTLTAVKPSAGSSAGGDAVVFNGLGFAGGSLAFLGYRPLTQVAVPSGTTLSGLTPSAPGGLVDAAVTRPDGLSAVLKAAWSFNAPAPQIELVFPAVGPVGGSATVVVSGTGFVDGATVQFGETFAKKTTFVAPNVLIAVTAPVAVPGKVDVTVLHPDGKKALAEGAYAYTDKQPGKGPAPTAVTPPKGPWQGGSVVVVWGDNFHPGAQVLFGSKPAKVHLVTPTYITLTTPPGAIGPADLTVLNADGQGSTLGNAWQYFAPTAPAPKLYGITPPTGPEKGGTAVLLTGDKFSPGGLGLVGWRPLGAWTVLNTAIGTGTTPMIPAGKQPVVVTNGDGQSATLADAFTSIGAPQIDSFTPTVGPIAGGTLLTLAGKHFASGAEIWFGGKKAKEVNVLSEFVLKVVTPAADAGPTQVKIVNADGQSAVAPEPFLFVAPPKLSEVFAPQGPEKGGVPVLVLGDNLLPGSVVRFGAIAAKSAQAADGKSLLVWTPPLPQGPKDVYVDSPTGESAVLKGGYTVVADDKVGKAPAIEMLVPATGPLPGGTWGKLLGADLQKGARAVFGVRPADQSEQLDPGMLRVVSPPGDVTGAVDILVINPDGSWASQQKGYDYTDPASLGVGPKLTGLDPAKGATKGGTAVTLLGTGLDEKGLGWFGNLPATGSKAVTGGIQVTTPGHAAGTVDVRHTDEEGRTVLLAGAYSFTPPPKPLAVTPGQGPSTGGTFVTITGSDFNTESAALIKVLFCTSFAANQDCAAVPSGEISAKSKTEVVVAAPAHVAGLADVVVINPDGQAGVAAQAYLYLPPPKILDVKPASGSTLGGTVVTLTGTGFQSGAEVLVGGAKGSEVSVDSGTKLTLKTPPGAAGPAALVVVNPDKAQHLLQGGFVYIAPPKIVAVFPTLGPETGGTVVTIQGEAFVQGVQGSKVEIGGKAVPESDLTVKSAEIIQIKTPPGTGPAALKVINPDGQFAVKSGAFVYIPVVPPPKITYTTPKFAPTGGGTLVSVYGQGFLEGMQIAFGNNAVGWTSGSGVTVLNNGTLAMVTTPPMDPGLWSVRATNSDGQTGALDDAFEMTTALALPGLGFGGVIPNRGPIKGGYKVVVYGQGFLNGVKVYFGSATTANWTEATAVTRLGPTLLEVIVPGWPKAEKTDIRVVNPVVGGKSAEVVGKQVWNFGQAVVLTTKGHRLPPDVSQADNQAIVFDANGDGLNDILVLKHETWENSRDDLYIQVKDENGKLGKFVDQSVALLPALPNYPYGYRWDPIATDVDKDGDIDVLFRNNPGWQHLLLYRNQGDGQFKIENLGTYPSFNTVKRLISGDLTCDGIDDLLVVANNAQKYILVGNGKGGFTAKTGVFPNHTEPSMSAAIGDVDKDGDNDIVVVNDQAFQNRLYLNNCNNVAKGQPHSFGDAQYGNGKNFPISGFNSRDVQLVDINGDQWLDVVLVNWGQSTRLYLNNGGNFLNDNGQLFPQSEALVYSARVHLADVDLDGDKDMVVLKYRADGQYWPNLYLSNLAQGGQGGFVDASKTNVPAFRGEDGSDVQVADLNGDKLPDLYITRTNHQDWLMLNNGYAEDKAMTDANRVPKGSFANNTIYGLPETTLDHTSGDAGDIDGDGDPDIVMVTNLSGYGQSVRVWVNDGSGAFFDESNARAPDIGCHAQKVRLVDLNNDKDLDLVVACYYSGNSTTGGLRQLSNDGKGKFKDVSNTNMPGAYTGEYWFDIEVGDLDGDGDPDAIATGTNAYTARVMVNGGDPFNTGGAYFFVNNNLMNIGSTGIHFRSVIIGDLSGDGQNDVYLGTNTQNQLWHNKGGGTMQNVSVSHLPSLSDDTRKVLMCDVDLDKDMDLFVIDNGPIRLNLSELDHKYSDITASHLPGGVGGNGQGAAIADLDFDGYPDIVTANWNQQNVLMLNQSAGAFANFTGQMPPDSDYSHEIVIADFDLDGRPDLFVCNAGQNRVYWNETPLK